MGSNPARLGAAPRKQLAVATLESGTNPCPFEKKEGKHPMATRLTNT